MGWLFLFYIPFSVDAALSQVLVMLQFEYFIYVGEGKVYATDLLGGGYCRTRHINSRSHDVCSRSHDIGLRSYDIDLRSHDIDPRSHDIVFVIKSRSHDIASRSHDEPLIISPCRV